MTVQFLGSYQLSGFSEENFNMIVNGQVYFFNQKWNIKGQFWTLSILDSSRNAIVSGIRIVSGINILEQYPEINFNIKIETRTDPKRNNLELYKLRFYSK